MTGPEANELLLREQARADAAIERVHSMPRITVAQANAEVRAMVASQDEVRVSKREQRRARPYVFPEA